MAKQIFLDVQVPTDNIDKANTAVDGLVDNAEKAAETFDKVNDSLKGVSDQAKAAGTATSGMSNGVSKAQADYNKLAASMASLSANARVAAASILKLTPDQLQTELKNLDTTVEGLIQGLKELPPEVDKAAKSYSGLQGALRSANEGLKELQDQGITTGKQYDDQVEKIALATKALNTQRNAIKNLASDSPTLRLTGQALEGIAGAAETGVGIFTLFGDKSEALQETLLKVNQVMAISAGISKLNSLLKNDEFVATSKLIAAEALENTQTAISNGLQSESVVVRLAAAAAQRVLNAALSVGVIGAVIIAVSALIALYEVFKDSTDKAAEAQKQFEDELRNVNEGFDSQVAIIKRTGDVRLAALKQQGAQESTLLRAQLEDNAALQAAAAEKRYNSAQLYNAALDKLQRATVKNDKDLIEQATKDRDDADKAYTAAQQEELNLRAEHDKLYYSKLTEDQVEAYQRIIDGDKGRLAIAIKNSDAEFEYRRKVAMATADLEIYQAGQNKAKQILIARELSKTLNDIEQDRLKRDFSNEDAVRETNLIALQQKQLQINGRTNQFIVDAEKDRIRETAQFQANLDGVTEENRQKLYAEANAKIFALDQDYAKKRIEYAKQDQIDLNSVEVDLVQTTAARKLELELQNLDAERDKTLANQMLTQAEVLKITADTEAKKLALQKQYDEARFQEQLALFDRQSAAEIANTKFTLAQQDAIRSSLNPKAYAKTLGVAKLTNQQIVQDTAKSFDKEDDRLQMQSDFNDQQLEKQQISYEQYQKNKDALDAQVSANLTARNQTVNQTQAQLDEKRRQQNLQIAQGAIQGVSQGLDVLASLYQQEDKADQDRLDAKKQRVQDELNAGNISAKEAKRRDQELDVEQKQLQYRQAKRNKEIAIFQAIVNTAAAVVSQLTAGPVVGLVLAAIAGAIGAAQIAVIASQPLPTFNKGKKNRFEGFGRIAERNPEIFETDGQQYYVRKPQTVWLSATDKVYTPTETVKMMASVPEGSAAPVEFKQEKIDYTKLGETIARNIPSSTFTVDKNGFNAYQERQNAYVKRRQSSRKWL